MVFRLFGLNADDGRHDPRRVWLNCLEIVQHMGGSLK